MNIIRRAKEDNPELSLGFINNALLSEAEMNNGEVKRYKRRTKRRLMKWIVPEVKE